MSVRLDRAAGGYLGQQVDAAQASVTLVRFTIGDLIFATPLTSVAAVMAASMMTRTEDGGTATKVIGRVRSLNGEVDVVDGARLMGFTGDVETPRVLVLRGGRPVGITISQVLESSEASPDEIVHFNEVVSRRVRRSMAEGLFWRSEGTAELLFDTQEAIRSRDTSRPADEDSTNDRTRLAARYRSLDRTDLLEISLLGSDERWGVPTGAIRHVADLREPLPLPGAPPDVLGLLSWQRRPIPVIDPAHRLELNSDVGLRRRLIVAGPPGEPAEVADGAILVADVRGLNTNMQVDGHVARNAYGDQLRILDLVELLQA